VPPHDPPGSFDGVIAPDGRSIYLVSDANRDKTAFARVGIEPARAVGAAQIIAARDDAELSAFQINDQGTTAALLWNVAGRNELAFVDLASGKVSAGPRLPGEIAGGMTFTKDGKRLAMTIAGAIRWIASRPR
jgi:hypothetical protein